MTLNTDFNVRKKHDLTWETKIIKFKILLFFSSGVWLSTLGVHTEVPICIIGPIYLIQKHCFSKFSSVRDRNFASIILCEFKRID